MRKGACGSVGPCSINARGLTPPASEAPACAPMPLVGGVRFAPLSLGGLGQIFCSLQVAGCVTTFQVDGLVSVRIGPQIRFSGLGPQCSLLCSGKTYLQWIEVFKKRVVLYMSINFQVVVLFEPPLCFTCVCFIV